MALTEIKSVDNQWLILTGTSPEVLAWLNGKKINEVKIISFVLGDKILGTALYTLIVYVPPNGLI